MICIAENTGGKGGIAGGEGASGQASSVASGAGASSYGYPVIEVTTGMSSTVQVQLTKDTKGEVASDLTGITKVEFIARPSMISTGRLIKVECTYTTAGVVTLTLSQDAVKYNNGVWFALFLCYKDTAVLQIYRAYLAIRKGMTDGALGTNTVTIMDIRLALMDTSALANLLIDDLEFSDMMILHAVLRCIDEWNETPPLIAAVYDATNFPYKEHLIKGAVGYLMLMIANRYNRNRMIYQASGLSLDSNDKGPMYLQLATAKRGEWKSFVAAKKTEQSMYDTWGTFLLPYFSNGYW